MKFQEVTISLSDGSNITIIHNLGAELYAALENWLVRTKKYTAESLCDYINEKRLRGLSDHYAFTQTRWKELQQEANRKKNGTQ